MSAPIPVQQLTTKFGVDRTSLLSAPQGWELELPLPVLAGSALETLSVPGGAVETLEGGCLLRGPDSLAGVLIRETDAESLEEDAAWIYTRLLAACGEFPLYRAWNYVPQINTIYEGLENYHRFNLGRARAYKVCFGEEMEARFPAASAVGIHDGTLVTIFTAGSDPVRYVENPEQLPAYAYPSEYGPRPPSFSRATLRSRAAEGGSTVYLSGTASIKGHATMGGGDVALQCEITCDNIRLVYESMGLPDPLAALSKSCQAKVYLRHASDLEVVKAALHRCAAGSLANEATILEAELCRRDLDVEIELTGC